MNDTSAPPADWPAWLQAMFPQTYAGPLAPYHADFWDWLWSVPNVGAAADSRNTFVAIWARGWAKSTNIEAGVVALAGHSRRRYGWYISAQQTQADDHLGTVSEKMVGSQAAQYYPGLASVRVQVVGEKTRQRGWRRNRMG